MPRQPKFDVVETSKGFKVDIPAKLSPTGKRERHFFKTKTAAKTHASEIKKRFTETGSNASTIRPALAEDAYQAAAILSPWSVSLVEAAHIVAGIKRAQSASRPLVEAVDLWIVSCESLRPRTLDGYLQTTRKLKAGLGEKTLAVITSDDLQEVVCPLGSAGAAIEGHFRNARAFWKWSAKKGWCEDEVFSRIEKPRKSKEQDAIEILSPDQAKNLLSIASKYYPQAVANYALQLFAGIRVEEITRLGIEHVTSEGIELPASVTKKGRRRHITPNETLKSWLEIHPFTPCENWREVDKACRRLAGWDVSSRLLPKPPKATLGTWPQNALRHSHASYAIAAGATLENLLFEFGHVGNPNVLRQHYLGRATKKEAIQFYAILPKGKKIQSLKAL